MCYLFGAYHVPKRGRENGFKSRINGIPWQSIGRGGAGGGWGCEGRERVSGRYAAFSTRKLGSQLFSATHPSVSPKEQDRYSGEESAGKWFPRFTAVLLLFAVLLFCVALTPLRTQPRSVSERRQSIAHIGKCFPKIHRFSSL